MTSDQPQRRLTGDPGRGPVSRSGRSAVRASQLRRPTWRDPRLIAGAVFVCLAVVLGGWGVARASQTQDMYVAAKDIVPGDSLEGGDVLRLVPVSTGEVSGSYIAAGKLPKHPVATRGVKAGELVPAAAVSDKATSQRRSVVVEVSSALPAGTSAGDVVDLWKLPAAVAANDGSGAAETVASELIIASVGQTDPGALGGTTTTSVEVLVEESKVADVLTAIGSGGSLVLVPTGRSV